MQTRALAAEFLGTLLIVASVVGASFMGEQLGAGEALGLAINAGATSAVLYVVIVFLRPVSGAHFNPAVSLALLIQKRISSRDFLAYVPVQFLGGVAGAVLGNLMFERAALPISSIERYSLGTAIGELVATFGLVLLILVLVQQQRYSLIAPGVALWILAGHFFTSSTSLANPAVSLGRVFTEAASGIEPLSMLWFWLFQISGALLALLVFQVLTKKETANV